MMRGRLRVSGSPVSDPACIAPNMSAVYLGLLVAVFPRGSTSLMLCEASAIAALLRLAARVFTFARVSVEAIAQ